MNNHPYDPGDIPNELVDLVRIVCKKVLLKEKIEMQEAAKVKHILIDPKYDKAIDALLVEVRAELGVLPI